VGPDHRHPGSQTAAPHPPPAIAAQNGQLAIADDEGVTVVEVMDSTG
jgi:hypothetical protein